MKFLCKNESSQRMWFEGNNGNRYYCPLRRVGLMKCHDVVAIFGNKNVPAAGGYCWRNPNVPIRIEPFFDHPHDLWMTKKGNEGVFRGKIVKASYDGKSGFLGLKKSPLHLLIELEKNVFAFAETANFRNNTELLGKEVTFYFLKYNSKTKKIYGNI